MPRRTRSLADRSRPTRSGAAGTRRVRHRGEHGSVTAETAVVLPVLVVVLLACVWVLAAVGAQLRCVDAARAAARLAARGEAPAAVQAVGLASAPPGADLLVRRTGDEVRVEVRADVRPFAALPALPGLSVSGRAVAVAEDVPS